LIAGGKLGFIGLYESMICSVFFAITKV